MRETHIAYLLHQVVTLLSYSDINSMSLVAPSIPFRSVILLNYYMINPKKIYIQSFHLKNWLYIVMYNDVYFLPYELT